MGVHGRCTTQELWKRTSLGQPALLLLHPAERVEVGVAPLRGRRCRRIVREHVTDERLGGLELVRRRMLLDQLIDVLRQAGLVLLLPLPGGVQQAWQHGHCRQQPQQLQHPTRPQRAFYVLQAPTVSAAASYPPACTGLLMADLRGNVR